MNIHNQISQLNAHMELLISQYPELDADEDLRADMFEGETDITVVLSKLTNMALDAASMAEAVKLRVADLAERKKRFDAKEESIRKLIASIMDNAGLSKMQLTEATLSIRHIDPKPIVTDIDRLPDYCVRIEKKVDAKAIKECHEKGEVIPGTTLSNGYNSLTIRTK